MIDTLITFIGGIAISIITYRKGKVDGRKEKNEEYIIVQIDKAVDLYNEWDRAAKDNGIHALSKLGLEILQSDENIRKVIEKIEITSGKNPFGRYKELVSDLDLFDFFKYIRKQNIDVLRKNIPDIISEMRL